MKKEFKSLVEKLKEGNVVFTIGDKSTKYKMSRFESEHSSTSFYVSSGIYGMNVDTFGPTCMHLYTFDMFSTKTVAKIKYSEIKIVKE